MPHDRCSRSDGGGGEFGAQRGLQQGHIFHTTHASKVALDMEQRRGDPALLLIAVLPMIHTLRLAFDLRHHAFDQVGRVETAAQVLRHPEAMHRECFVEAFFQTARRRFVELGLFVHKAEQRALRVGVARVRIHARAPRMFVYSCSSRRITELAR